MATVRDGDKTVLLIVDVQVGVVCDAWQAPRVIANVARTVARARAEGVPVLWVQHADEQLVSGSDAWQWVPELVPGGGEPVIHKAFNSAFEQTPLEDQLQRLGATRIVLAGAASNWCIRATAYAALERGYDLTLVSDAHTTESMAPEGGPKIAAASVIDELNIAMTWLSYPGRSNNIATAEQVNFTGTPPARA